MKPSESIKPISYLKAHASEVIRDVVNNQKTLVITTMAKQKLSSRMCGFMSKSKRASLC